ncbi:MAG: 2-amino-4-hydroxy-6-hydroxymethyldihydropteridine diphosphokinase [Planctomycetaceae bacterium]
MSPLPSTSHLSTPRSAWIALGGNLGDVDSTIAQALQLLNDTPGIALLSSSTMHRTAPVGDNAGTPFGNAVAHLATDLEPLELLNRLQEIETQLGRVRTMRWGPRTLDLDLLLYGDEVIDHPRLQIPQPACWYRRFVLDPWVEIGAYVIHSVKRLTIGELRARLLVRPLSFTLVGGSLKQRDELLRTLNRQFPKIQWSVVINLDDEPTISIGLGPGDGDIARYVQFRQTFAVSWLELRTPATTELEAIREIVHSATGE